MKFSILLILTISISITSTSKQGKHEDISGFFVAENDVKFYLFTRLNPNAGQELKFNDVNSIRNSNYDGNKPTRFIIHGWNSDSNTDSVVLITNSYVRSDDVNAVLVDWGVGAQTINYIVARNRVNEVGSFIAAFCDFLHQNNALDFSRLHIVGGSLGAHIAGIVGKNVRRGRVNTIFGLDPAGPLFSVDSPSTRVSIGDADYVECIHTDIFNLGIGAAICDTDFYPNGGTNQTGCSTSLCSHSRSFFLFADTLTTNLLWGRRCNDISEIAAGCNGVGAFMGGRQGNFGQNVNGIFTLPTNGNSPYGIGRF